MSNQTKGDLNVTEAGANRINEALDLLNREAREKRAEIIHLLNERYSNFREVLGEILGGRMEKIKEVVTAGEEKIKEVSTGVERRIYENPWLSVGVSAASGFLLGYFIGSRCAEER